MINCKRRELLRWSAVGLGALALNARATAAQQTHSVSAEVLRPGLLLLRSAGVNAIATIAADGILLIDSAEADHATGLLDALGERSGDLNVTVAYNTHWHYEHNGCNEQLRKQGARLIAHENTRLWLGGDFYSDWQQRHYRPRPELALPNATFYDRHELRFGGDQVNAAVMPNAHTDGDIYVHLTASNLLVVGGVMADGVFPVPDPATGGWIGGLVDAQARLLELADDETLIVPARGAVQRKADLQRQHAMLTEMCDRLYAMVKKGMGANDMLAANIAKGFESWGDPTLFVRNCYPGLWLHPAYSARGIV